MMASIADNRDRLYMAQALELARKGIGLTSPNPNVGAVIVDASGENIVGRGIHTYDGKTHAEIHALNEAGERARGGTLYINLEPCCHHGRTPPCVDEVMRSGVSRVVLAMRDPNPLVSGQSVEKMEAAGIEVQVGTEEQDARKLNEAFAKYIRQRRPLVTLKAGMTLDGKIAPPPGESSVVSALGSGAAGSGWITSKRARDHVHELRHASDAILVGVGTIIADDPLLTDRSGEARRRRLLRIILDSRLRLPLDSRIVKTSREDVIVFCSFAEEKKRAALEARGILVQQIPLGGRDGRPDLERVMERLGEMEITSVLVEGGALVNWAALVAGIVDKVFLYYAPKILAGTGSVPFAAGAGFRRMSEAAQVHSLTLHRFGGTDDFAVEGYIRDPYAYEVADNSPAAEAACASEPSEVAETAAGIKDHNH